MDSIVRQFRAALLWLLRPIAFPTAWAYFWARYFLWDKARFRVVVHWPAGPHDQRAKTWAIVAGQAQNGRVSPNLARACAVLREHSVRVLLVVSGKLEASSVPSLKDVADVLIQQSDIGRDFGAYKTGFEYLRQMDNGHIERVLFFNDSVVFFPRRFAALLDEVLGLTCDFLGMVESYERSYHVQSWGFGVSGRLFRSPWFADYWRSFPRVSFRPYIIKAGELRLTKILRRHGYEPLVVCSAATALRMLKERGWEWVADSVVRQPLPRFGVGPSDVYDWLGKLLAHEWVARLLSTRSIMHTVNLPLIAAINWPFLKRDLVRRGLYEPATVELFFTTMSAKGDLDVTEVMEEIRAVMRAPETVRWTRGLRGVLLRLGII